MRAWSGPGCDRVAQIDVRAAGMVGDHISEQIGGNTAISPAGTSRHAIVAGDVKAGSDDDGKIGIAPVGRLHGHEIDQCVAATEEHEASPLTHFFRRSTTAPSIASGSPGRAVASAHRPVVSPRERSPSAAPSARSTVRPRHPRHRFKNDRSTPRRRPRHGGSKQNRLRRHRQTDPDPVASAVIRRTRGLRLARRSSPSPPLGIRAPAWRRPHPPARKRDHKARQGRGAPGCRRRCQGRGPQRWRALGSA